MADLTKQRIPELEGALWRLFRDFFTRAERKRRWSLTDDIPWDQCNRNLDPAIASVVESYCAVELFLPDYIVKSLAGLPTTSSVEVSIPRERSRQSIVTFRGSSSPLCLACAWHGEVSGTPRFQIPPGGKEETTPSFHGNMNRPEPVELFGAVSVLPRMDAVA